MKILIIDDEEDIRQIARFALSKVGSWDVLEASNGAEGIEKAQSNLPDAILLDVLMPLLDGPETLSRLRANGATVNIPIVFLTARGLPEEKERLRKLGAAGVITKPFDPMTLAEELEAILGGRS